MGLVKKNKVVHYVRIGNRKWNCQVVSCGSSPRINLRFSKYHTLSCWLIPSLWALAASAHFPKVFRCSCSQIELNIQHVIHSVVYILVPPKWPRVRVTDQTATLVQTPYSKQNAFGMETSHFLIDSGFSFTSLCFLCGSSEVIVEALFCFVFLRRLMGLLAHPQVYIKISIWANCKN